MHVLLDVSSPNDLSDERIAVAARDLLKVIRAEADPHASFSKINDESDSKGDLAMLGQIALALVSGGAIGKFIEGLFNFIGRNRKIAIDVQNAAGEKLKLDFDFVDQHGFDGTTAILENFFKKAY